MRKPPQQEILYSLIEASDMEWFKSGMGTPSVIAHAMGVDFQHRTIILPEGKFDLDSFLHTVESIRDSLCAAEDILPRLPR